VAKLSSEYEIERSSRDEEVDFSSSVKEYLDESSFQVRSDDTYVYEFEPN
jgi:hypothetical protein